MKIIIFFALIALSTNMNAQIILEYDYDSAATYNVGGGKVSQLLKVQFEQSGERYVKINRWNNFISIYDLNHSLTKNIDCSSLPLDPTSNRIGGILYLSEKLFDNDPGIEFFYYVTLAGGIPYTGIYNDDASLLFSDTGAAWIYPGIPSQQFPIYNTSLGTKMILSYTNGHAKVFSLPGTLSTAIKETNEKLIEAGNLLSTPSPNPAINSTRIDYKLPDGANEGEIIFYDLQGKEVKRFTVDTTFDHLSVSTADLAAGTYYYQLQATGFASEGKKMVVIK